jgi:hypothetical protein
MDEMTTETSAANADAVIDAAPEGTATPTDTASTETTTIETPVDAPQETETQAFAHRLKEKTAEAEKAAYDKVNAVIAKLGGITPEGTPILTYEDLQRTLDYQEMQAKAAEQNVPVELYSRLTQAEQDALEAKTMLSEYQRKDALAKEAETLAVDPKWGTFYKAHEADIKAAADQFKCDLGTAKLIVYDNIGPEKVDEAAIANKAIQEFVEGKRTSYKPVEGSGATPTQVVAAPKTWADAREGSRAILRALREQT